MSEEAEQPKSVNVEVNMVNGGLSLSKAVRGYKVHDNVLAVFESTGDVTIYPLFQIQFATISFNN